MASRTSPESETVKPGSEQAAKAAEAVKPAAPATAGKSIY